MKFSLFFIPVFALLTCVTGNAQTVTMDVRNIALEEVLKEIANQSGYNYSYTSEIMQKAKKINHLVAKGETVLQVLEKCFKDQPVTYEILDKIITVKEVPDIKIAGRIVKKNKEPLPGESIKIEGATTGTTTNGDGRFYLDNVKANANLIITGTDIKEFRIKANEIKGIDLEVDTIVSTLNEVIVQNYWENKRKYMTGSVATANSTYITLQPVGNPLTTLGGLLAGVGVTHGSGNPSAKNDVRIRGNNFLFSGNDPLFIIDGVPFTNNTLTQPLVNSALTISGGQSPLSNIAISDIESITVLKDASSTAIYGSRGANGVILITTKKATLGKARGNFNIYKGIGKAQGIMQYLNTQQYLEMRHEAFINGNTNPNDSNAPDVTVWNNSRYTNWEKMLIGEAAKITEMQAAISGGNPNSIFSIRFNYRRESTVYSEDFNNKRASVYLNAGHTSPNKKFHINVTSIFSNNRNKLPNIDITQSLATLPNAPGVYNGDGSLNWSSQGISFNNPLSPLKRPSSITINNLFTNFKLTYAVLPGLNIKSNFGYVDIHSTQEQISPKISFNPLTNPVSSSAFGVNNYTSWIIEQLLEYYKRIGKCSLNVLIGGSWQQELTKGYTIQASGFASDILIRNPAAAATTSYSINNSLYKYQSGFGRINFNIDNEYIFDLTGRRDGSSRFGPGNQFGNFGAIAGAWIFTKRDRFRQLKFLNFGKLRASYGITGNDKIGDYQYIPTYAPATNQYQQPALVPTRLFNPDFAWEVNKKTEAGLDIELFNHKVFSTLNYFFNRSGNQLVRYPVSGQTGFSYITSNFPAIIRNSGWELELSAAIINNELFNWKTSFNITIARNQLSAFPGLETSPYADIYAVGHSTNIRKLLHFTGINPDSGYYQFQSIDPKDRTIIKDLNPKFYGGLLNTISYKGFQLDILLQFVKQDGENYLKFISLPGIRVNQPVYILDRWTKPGDNAVMQSYSYTTQNNAGKAFKNLQISDATISDASYLRLKNFSISYRFPKKLLEKMKMQSLKLYMHGQNLITITKYKGADPEIQRLDILPPLKMYVLGAQLDL